MTQLRPSLLALLMVPVLALGSTGCFKIKQRVVLQPDMSGQADLSISLSYAGVARIMLQFQKVMLEDDTPVTDAEVNAMVAEMRGEMEADGENPDAELAAKAEQLAASMPAGVTVLAYRFVPNAEAVEAELSLSFDHIDTLLALSSAALRDEMPAIMGGGMGESLFGDLLISEKGKKVIVDGSPMSLGLDEMAGDGLDLGPILQEMMGDMEAVFELETPMRIARSNATDKQPGVHRWVWDWAALEKLEKSKKSAIKVVLKR